MLPQFNTLVTWLSLSLLLLTTLTSAAALLHLEALSACKNQGMLSILRQSYATAASSFCSNFLGAAPVAKTITTSMPPPRITIPTFTTKTSIIKTATVTFIENAKRDLNLLDSRQLPGFPNCFPDGNDMFFSALLGANAPGLCSCLVKPEKPTSTVTLTLPPTHTNFVTSTINEQKGVTLTIPVFTTLH